MKYKIGDKFNVIIPGFSPTVANIDNIKERPAPICTYKLDFEYEKGKKVKKLEYIFLSEIKS